LAVEECEALSPPALHLYGCIQSASVTMPYLVNLLTLLLLAGMIARRILPKIEHADTALREDQRLRLDHPNLIFGALGSCLRRRGSLHRSFLVNYSARRISLSSLRENRAG